MILILILENNPLGHVQKPLLFSLLIPEGFYPRFDRHRYSWYLNMKLKIWWVVTRTI